MTRPDDPPRAPEDALVPVPTGALTVGEAPDASAASAPIKLSLVIPTYNERENIAELVALLGALLDPPLGDAYELVLVDDDSPDRTWEAALALSADNPRLRVMRRVGERCLSTAVIRGWQASRGEVLGVIDADLQHPPELTKALWDEMARGADLAVGSRHVEGGGVSDWSLSRRILSRGAQALGLAILPRVVSRVADPMSGYFMVRRSAILGKPMDPLGYKILIEVLGRGHIGVIREVGYVFRERSEGESKVTKRLYLDYLRQLVRLRRAAETG
ncbi:MAG: polyprenol monophosphomannose synthase [Byssovorax sp.]